jgi:hypothetical protein
MASNPIDPSQPSSMNQSIITRYQSSIKKYNHRKKYSHALMLCCTVFSPSLRALYFVYSRSLASRLAPAPRLSRSPSLSFESKLSLPLSLSLFNSCSFSLAPLFSPVFPGSFLSLSSHLTSHSLSQPATSSESPLPLLSVCLGRWQAARASEIKGAAVVEATMARASADTGPSGCQDAAPRERAW